jgi:hypothetical protein
MDALLQPLDWAQRTGNVKVRYMHDVGGHFPAWEQPEMLAKDLRAFFGDQELSHTGIFVHMERHDSKDEL